MCLHLSYLPFCLLLSSFLPFTAVMRFTPLAKQHGLEAPQQLCHLSHSRAVTARMGLPVCGMVRAAEFMGRMSRCSLNRVCRCWVLGQGLCPFMLHWSIKDNMPWEDWLLLKESMEARLWREKQAREAAIRARGAADHVHMHTRHGAQSPSTDLHGNQLPTTQGTSTQGVRSGHAVGSSTGRASGSAVLSTEAPASQDSHSFTQQYPGNLM
jgi:hypothetical protein